jgi:hypothetical protein
MTAAESQRLTKRVGRVRLSNSPADYHRRALALATEVERIRGRLRSRGFVFKAATWEKYDEWRRSQTDPRFW